MNNVSGIYKIQNKINNKVYIGLSSNIRHRWQQHISALNKNKHHNAHLQSSWNKYGENSFVFDVVEKCEIDDLTKREIYWIKKFDSFKNGYNRTVGGEDGQRGKSKYRLNANQLAALDKARRNRVWTEEQRENARKNIFKQFESESFKKAFKDEIDRQKKAVKCYTKDGTYITYESIASASEATGAFRTNIVKILKGKAKTSLGYTFCYDANKLSDYDIKCRFSKQETDPDRPRKRRVAEIDSCGNIIKIYETLNEAAVETMSDSSSISKVCKGKLKQTKGKLFSYV